MSSLFFKHTILHSYYIHLAFILCLSSILCSIALPALATKPTLPPKQIDPESPFNTEDVHHSFYEDKVRAEDEGQDVEANLMTVAELESHERGTDAVPLAVPGSLSIRRQVNPILLLVMPERQRSTKLQQANEFERHLVKYLVDVSSDAFNIIKQYLSGRFSFFCLYWQGSKQSYIKANWIFCLLMIMKLL